MYYNGNDFMKASKLAEELNFEEYNVSLTHRENYFVLFMDEFNGTWAIEPTYSGNFNLCYEFEKVCIIHNELQKELEKFIDEKLNEQQMQGKLSQDYIDTRDYLFREFGFGKN